VNRAFPSTVLAVALTVGLQAAGAEQSPPPTETLATTRPTESEAAAPAGGSPSIQWRLLPRRGSDHGDDALRFALLPSTTDDGRWSDLDDESTRLKVQFQLPPKQPEAGAPPPPATTRLTYQYAYGSESDIVYRRNRDLHDLVRDNSLLLKPQLNGIIVYRPYDWLETVLEGILEWEIPVQEESKVILPNGELERAPKRRLSLLVDQAFVKVHQIISPFEISVGRKNYEDERHWLYDTSLDIASVAVKAGPFRIEATAGREVYLDLDLAPNQRQPRDRIDTYILYADYRGIEDHRFAAYTIVRDDLLTEKQRRLLERKTRAQLIGVRALGRPSDSFNYWIEIAQLIGKDGPSVGGPVRGGTPTKRFAAHGYDVGATFRFPWIPFSPSITVSYAVGSGDESPNDRHNNQFRQSGLHTNETRFGGLSKFKIYGEALDPELSNIEIFTAGVGFRPFSNVFVDVVWHRYRLDEFAQSLSNSALTAEMNQVDPLRPRSKDVGSGLDLVIGFRRLFGLRRLGLDVRMGWFYPGQAFLRNQGDEEAPVIRRADQAMSVIAKFWW